MEFRRVLFRSGVKSSLLAAVSLALAGCAATGGGETASASDKPAEKPAKFNKNPYPSTYKPYPGQVTAVRNVTIFDGEGGRIDNGTVLLADGKVEAIGGPETPIPAEDRKSTRLNSSH